ncbi:PREDICTED: probable WRKY transcription factor 26 isoform X2 [Ipomoea nil]|uniref:probable WRKY transcription factor 26 isoform X2 n=1 Tax=Ipomoea nil TaxID=35883 RepID=UPI000900E7B6|nr:PREDICTED: probable WRKY transcription factor 26 isoform X2 [Ipomoea nil]
MAASSGTVDASTVSSSFSFSTAPSSFMSTSFTDLLASDDYPSTAAGASASRGLADRIAERTGSGVPKFKSLPPPSLPLSPPSVSPSSYFAFPPGLSPSELLDSPVLLSSSNILPSPTTGTFPALNFNWKNDSNTTQEDVKQEDKGYPDFSFQTNSVSMTLNYEDSKRKDGLSSEKTVSEFNSLQQSLPPVTTSTQMSSQNYSEYNQCCPPSQTLREQRRSDDGYNWRKYGQKQVKGSENPRSYYKCTHPNCPTKKKVERALDGQITEIVYKGAHNHPKPQSTRRSSSSTASSASTLAAQSYNAPASEVPDQSYWSNGNGQMDSVATPENSSISIGDDEFEQSSQKRESGGGDEFDEDEPDAKRWKVENESEGVSAPGSRTVREPRVVVQTTSDIDILDDGYRWRKYGQKVVKGNPNPRSYYKCTSQGCPVRKHVERASHDIRSVITTYEGKHNHDVPAARGSGGHALNRGANPNNNAAMAMAIRPSTMSLQSNYPIPIPSTRPIPGEGQAPYEMLQGPGSFGYSGFGNPMNGYANQIQDNAFSRAKEEPRDDLFLETLLA